MEIPNKTQETQYFIGDPELPVVQKNEPLLGCDIACPEADKYYECPCPGDLCTNVHDTI